MSPGFALGLLNAIDPDNLPKKFKSLYYNNKLSLLLISEKLERANILYTKHSDIIKSGLHNKKLKMCVKSTLATYEIYFGDMAESKKVFLSLLESDHSDFSTGLYYYYLGLIESKYNNVEESLEYFNKAKKLGAGSFIPEKVEAIDFCIDGRQIKQGQIKYA